MISRSNCITAAGNDEEHTQNPAAANRIRFFVISPRRALNLSNLDKEEGVQVKGAGCTSISTQPTKRAEVERHGQARKPDRYPWRYAPEEGDFIVLEDPDGNLFCVVQDPGD